VAARQRIADRWSIDRMAERYEALWLQAARGELPAPAGLWRKVAST
jgi:hypothetical protein